MKEKKSKDYYIAIPNGISKKNMQTIVDRAATSVGLYISHIGGYSKVKYPNSVHWHFKRDPKEKGLIDATFWDVKSLFWLMIRNREPQWVHLAVPGFILALEKEVKQLASCI